MPKSARDIYRRKLAQAYLYMNYAGTLLFELYNSFNPVHPDLGAMLQGSMEGLAVNQEILKEFAYKAWGKDNPDWESWQAQGRFLPEIELKLNNAPNEDIEDTSLSEDKINGGTDEP